MTPETLGKYQIIEVIGAGGSGTVYRAHDFALDRDVALKVLHPQLLSEPGFIERFHREARAAASLEHVHIVPIYEVGEADGRYYIAMRLLRGEPLNRLLERTQGSLPMDQVLGILRDLAEALDHAHHRDVVHRDVKPSNIFISDQGTVLADFGLVRSLTDVSQLTSTGHTLGTPTYMAPEQILGTLIGSYTDLYALGVVTYEMLAGRVPFSGTTPFAIQNGHVRQPIPSIRKYNRRLPEAIDNVLARVLTKDPFGRYEDAGSFVDAIEAALETAQSRSLTPGISTQISNLGAQGHNHCATMAPGFPQPDAPVSPVAMKIQSDQDRASRPTPLKTDATTPKPTLSSSRVAFSLGAIGLFTNTVAIVVTILSLLFSLLSAQALPGCSAGVLPGLVLGIVALIRWRTDRNPRATKVIGVLAVIPGVVFLLVTCVSVIWIFLAVVVDSL